MGKLIVVIVILGALLVAAEFIVQPVAEEEVAAQLTGDLGLAEEPEVSLGPHPFLLNGARGNFPKVRIAIDEMRTKGFKLTDMDLSLRGVGFSIPDMIAGDRSISIKGGSGHVDLTIPFLNLFLEKEQADFRFEPTEDEPVADVEQGGETALDLDISEDRLILDPEPLPPSALTAQGGAAEQPSTEAIELPRFLSNLTYESVTFGDGVVSIRFRLGPTILATPR